MYRLGTPPQQCTKSLNDRHTTCEIGPARYFKGTANLSNLSKSTPIQFLSLSHLYRPSTSSFVTSNHARPFLSYSFPSYPATSDLNTLSSFGRQQRSVMYRGDLASALEGAATITRGKASMTEQCLVQVWPSRKDASDNREIAEVKDR